MKFKRMTEKANDVSIPKCFRALAEGPTDDRHFRHRLQHVPGDLGSTNDASNNNRAIMSSMAF